MGLTSGKGQVLVYQEKAVTEVNYMRCANIIVLDCLNMKITY